MNIATHLTIEVENINPIKFTHSFLEQEIYGYGISFEHFNAAVKAHSWELVEKLSQKRFEFC